MVEKTTLHLGILPRLPIIKYLITVIPDTYIDKGEAVDSVIVTRIDKYADSLYVYS